MHFYHKLFPLVSKSAIFAQFEITKAYQSFNFITLGEGLDHTECGVFLYLCFKSFLLWYIVLLSLLHQVQDMYVFKLDLIGFMEIDWKMCPINFVSFMAPECSHIVSMLQPPMD